MAKKSAAKATESVEAVEPKLMSEVERKEYLFTAFHVNAADACARFAEALLWRGDEDLFLPGSGECVRAADLFSRARRVLKQHEEGAKRYGLSPYNLEKLQKFSGQQDENAGLLFEHAESAAWMLGLRERYPTHDFRVSPWVTRSLAVVWSGGLEANEKFKMRSAAEITRVKKEVAVWWWRAHTMYLKRNFQNLQKDYQGVVKSALELVPEFIAAVKRSRLVPLCVDDVLMSKGGPLHNNYFLDVHMEFKFLHRPRYLALRNGLFGAQSIREPDLGDLWEEVTGKPKSVLAKWPSSH